MECVDEPCQSGQNSQVIKIRAIQMRALPTEAISQARFVPGTLLAKRYRIVAPVGQGGMGEVYRAEDLRLGQTVALKFLPKIIAHIPDAWIQVEREVRIARQISHPKCLPCFRHRRE